MSAIATDWAGFRGAVVTAIEAAMPPAVLEAPTVLETCSVAWTDAARQHAHHRVLLSIVSAVFDDRDSALSTGGEQRLESMAVITVQVTAESTYDSPDMDALWLIEQLRLGLRKVSVRAALDTAGIVIQVFPRSTQNIGGTVDDRDLSVHALEVVFCCTFVLETTEDAGVIERIVAAGALEEGEITIELDIGDLDPDTEPGLAVITGSLTLPALVLSGSISPVVTPDVTVTLGGALALPSLGLTGALTPRVEAAGALALPGLGLAGEVSPVVAVAGALALPELTLAGEVSPEVTLAGSLALPSLALAGEITPVPPFAPSQIASLIAHWSGNGSTVASAPNRIAGSSVGAMAQATAADQPVLLTTTNGVQALSFDGVSDDMKTPDVAALRFTGPRGYWAWHIRSLETTGPGNIIGGQWAEGGTAERFEVVFWPQAGRVAVSVASSLSAYAEFQFGGTLAQLQAGCWLEVLFDGSQSIADSGLARCVLCIDGAPFARSAVSGGMPAALLPGDALNYWLGSRNGSINERIDVAHHYVANDIPTGPERAALRAFEAPQWDTPNLYVTPIFVEAGTAAGSLTVASVPWPAHAAGEVGVLVVETANQPIATPSGWTAVPNGSQGVGTAGSTTATGLQVFWRRAASGAEAAVSLTSTGDHVNGRILTFRGCIASGDPVDASAGNDGGDVNSTAVSIPGATTTVANCLVIAIASRQGTSSLQQSGQANASLTAVVELTETGLGLGNGGGFGIIAGTLAAAGAYSATTATLATASRQARVSLALKPNP